MDWEQEHTMNRGVLAIFRVDDDASVKGVIADGAFTGKMFENGRSWSRNKVDENFP